MSRRNWDKLARKQFDEMPTHFKDDWKELRRKIYKD